MIPELEYALRVLGYAAASHVLARASTSGRTGRYEETLSADLTDLLRVYGDAGRAFLTDVGAPASMTVRVWDVHKAAEARIGADFIIVFRATDWQSGSVQTVRKVVLIQAKRQDWGASRYASSSNHVAKAQAMLRARGSLRDCFFAYYHDVSALQNTAFLAPTWPSPPAGHSSPPRLWFATAAHGAAPYLAPHPSLQRSTFIERSGYRPAAVAAAGLFSAPAEWSWGVGLDDASYFINSVGVVQNQTLPPMTRVATRGRPLDEWLVGLADCSLGSPIASDTELSRLVARIAAGRTEEGDWAPSCIVEISIATGVAAGEANWELQDWSWEVEGITQMGS